MTDGDGSHPPTTRRRFFILLLAIATALLIVWALLTRPGHVALPRANALPCSAGQTKNCVGGQLDVVVVPRAETAASK